MGSSERNILTLESLADPLKYHEPLCIDGVENDLLVWLLRQMLEIRIAEQMLAQKRSEHLIGGPVHLGAGQEAIAVGISQVLDKNDRVFGAHRSHSHVLALGSSLHGLFAEVLGKDTGLSRGMGGSMHLWDQSHGFYGSVPIVSGTVALAVGAGLAARMQGTDRVGVSYLGDGAVEEGVVHESLNLARMLKAPVLFVVENNLFASHMHISLRQPTNATARFAVANDMPYEIIDGNDVVAVVEAAARLVQHARSGEGPVFLEAVTYRWYGHVDWRDDIDVGVERSVEHVANWKARDPIKRLTDAMVAGGIWRHEQTDALRGELTREADQAWEQAMADPYPSEDALLSRVYAK